MTKWKFKTKSKIKTASRPCKRRQSFFLYNQHNVTRILQVQLHCFFHLSYTDLSVGFLTAAEALLRTGCSQTQVLQQRQGRAAAPAHDLLLTSNSHSTTSSVWAPAADLGCAILPNRQPMQQELTQCHLPGLPHNQGGTHQNVQQKGKLLVCCTKMGPLSELSLQPRGIWSGDSGSPFL